MAINMKQAVRQMNELGIGQNLLQKVGLDYYQSAFTRTIGTIGVFSAGLLVGSAFGLFFAPMRGDELRTKARDNIDAMRIKMRNASEEELCPQCKDDSSTQTPTETSQSRGD
jgi:hypothetical protein